MEVSLTVGQFWTLVSVLFGAVIALVVYIYTTHRSEQATINRDNKEQLNMIGQTLAAIKEMLKNGQEHLARHDEELRDLRIAQSRRR